MSIFEKGIMKSIEVEINIQLQYWVLAIQRVVFLPPITTPPPALIFLIVQDYIIFYGLETIKSLSSLNRSQPVCLIPIWVSFLTFYYTRLQEIVRLNSYLPGHLIQQFLLLCLLNMVKSLQYPKAICLPRHITQLCIYWGLLALSSNQEMGMGFVYFQIL